MIEIMVLSDSVGETAESVIDACTAQFNIDEESLTLTRIPYIKSTDQLNVLYDIEYVQNTIIVYTFVVPEIKSHVVRIADELGIVAIDLMSPLLDVLSTKLGQSPKKEPGLVHRLDEEYFKKIDAIEFAVKYDDGRDVTGLDKADIVLIGISRTSKTPLSQYLAHKSYKVMNVPLVPEVDPPEELFNIDPNKCIALKIDSVKLNEIRKERLKQLGLDDHVSYARSERIEEELEHFHCVVERLQCEVIDVSHRAIEETANLIIKIIRKKRGAHENTRG